MRSRLVWTALTGAVLCLGALAPVGAQGIDVLTFHGSPDRLGWNSHETQLTPAHVNSRAFGKVWETALDGQVYGSPLYVSALAVNGKTQDVIFAATENNSVYALDAATGKVLWGPKTLAPPLHEAQYNDCNNIHPLHGITSTPVIDRQAGTIYVCGVTQKGLRQIYQVWGLDIATGDVRPGWPVTLKGSYQGCAFDGGQLTQRAGLNLVGDWLYIPFGSRCDIGEWHGWIMGVNVKDPSAAQRAFTPAPAVSGGGIWGSAGVAADADGNLYAVVGNGKYDLDKKGNDVCESILRLTGQGDALAFSGDRKDYYVPSNHQDLDDADEDMGGSSAILLPERTSGGGPRHLVVTCGKDGLVYMADRDALGGVGGEVYKRRLFGDAQGTYHSNIKTTPAYYDAGDAGQFVYVTGNETGPKREAGLVALKVGAKTLDTAWTLKTEMRQPGAPAVSSNGSKDGIVWVIESNKDDGDLGPPGVLHAFDAVSGKELYRSDASGTRDTLTDARKFSCPTVANGRVFVGTHGVVAYGPLAAQ